METTLKQETPKQFFDVEAFERIRLETLKAQIKVYPVNSIWASKVGHPCLRFNEYQITRWQDQLAIPPELQEIFNKGNEEEKIVNKKLMEMGFEARQQQRPLFEILNKNGTTFRYKISGRLDTEVMHPVITRGTWVKAEIKGLAPFSWDSIETLDDMLNHKQYYIRMYPTQLIAYLLKEGDDLGVFFLENKVTGRLKPIVTPLDYHIGERILSNGETINMVVEAVEKDPEHAEDLLSPRIEFDDKICSRCPFNHICLPNASFGGVEIDLDPETEAKLIKREELKKVKAEYKEIDEEIKSAFKARGIGKYMIGAGFNVSVEARHKDAFSVKASDYVQVNIEAVKK